jgi:hypothetical protein
MLERIVDPLTSTTERLARDDFAVYTFMRQGSWPIEAWWVEND